MYTAILLTLLLVGCLIGIGAGFYCAFAAADRHDPPGITGKNRLFKRLKRIFHPKGRQLHEKIHDQNRSSFSEFRCYETNQDHRATASEARVHQENSYSYIANGSDRGTHPANGNS